MPRSMAAETHFRKAAITTLRMVSDGMDVCVCVCVCVCVAAAAAV